MNHRAHRSFHMVGGGFSLIELLVSISIFSLLLALLIPSIAFVRFRTGCVQCSANLSEVGHVIHLFAEGNNDSPACTIRDRDYYWSKGDSLGWDIEAGKSIHVLNGQSSIWRCAQGETCFVGNSRALGLDNREALPGGVVHRVQRTQWQSTSRLVLAYDFQTNLLPAFPHASDVDAGDISDEMAGPWPRGPGSVEVELNRHKFGPHRGSYGALFTDGHVAVAKYQDRSALLWSGPPWWCGPAPLPTPE